MELHYDENIILQQLRDESTKREAFTIVVHEFQTQLYWHIRHMVLNHDDTDDALQNTFIKAWTGIDNFRGDCKLSSWLFRIASNEALNILESRKRQFDPVADNSYLSESLHSDPYFDGDETATKLQQAIDSLPNKQKQVFCMRYYDEMKYEDMSEILGTSVGALKASYHHAAKKITDFFEGVN